LSLVNDKLLVNENAFHLGQLYYTAELLQNEIRVVLFFNILQFFTQKVINKHIVVEVALETHDFEHITICDPTQRESGIVHYIENVFEHASSPIKYFLDGNHFFVI